MTTQSSIQLKLQLDSGSIFYQDKHDNITFHIEALRSKNTTTTTTTPSSSSKMPSSSLSSSSSDQASTPMTSDSEHEHTPTPAPARGDNNDEEADAETDLIKSFLRQHLVRNGEPSRCLVPLMRRDGIEAMLVATVALHLRKDGEGGDGAAVRSLYKTLGVLVSLLQQRGKVLEYLEGNPDVGRDGGEEE